MVEKIHIFITLIAALVINICCIASSNTLYETSMYLVITIVVFYIVGLYVRRVLTEMFFKEDESNEENGDSIEDGKEADTDVTPEAESVKK